MDKDFLLNMVINQIGEEKAKEVLNMLKGLADRMQPDSIYMLKKLPNKGVTLISTKDNDCKINFTAKPVQHELEKMLKEVEI